MVLVLALTFALLGLFVAMTLALTSALLSFPEPWSWDVCAFANITD